MRLLLDTHAFLWWLNDDPKLLAEARAAISDPTATVYVSAATIWELSIKARLGKLDLGDSDPVGEIAANDFLELPISAQHALVAGKLPRHHDDPFDRMLIAQAQLEELVSSRIGSRYWRPEPPEAEVPEGVSGFGGKLPAWESSRSFVHPER